MRNQIEMEAAPGFELGTTRERSHGSSRSCASMMQPAERPRAANRTCGGVARLQAEKPSFIDVLTRKRLESFDALGWRVRRIERYIRGSQGVCLICTGTNGVCHCDPAVREQ